MRYTSNFYLAVATRVCVCFWVYASIAPFAFGQNTVEVIYRGNFFNGPDGIAIDKKNNVFIANWGKDGKGTTLSKVDKDDKAQVFMDSLRSPDGLVFDRKGNLYISNFASGEIWKVNLKTKQFSVYAKLPGKPAGLAFDKKGNLFVADFGNFDGTKVYKIRKDGAVSVFADGFNAPLGLLFNKKGNLFVSNFGSGEIHKMDNKGNKTFFAALPDSPRAFIQFMVFERANYILIPSYGHNCIYRISEKGEIQKIESFVNKKTNEIYKLDGPNSIGVNQKGELFITEFNRNSLLKIQIL